MKSNRAKPQTILDVVLFNIVNLLLVGFTFFYAGEIYHRFFRDDTDAFAINKSTLRWMDRHYHLNNFGARDDQDYSPQIGKDKGRITFFGDSFTAGHGIEEVGDRFTNLIRAKLPTWEVHTMARNGHETADILPRIKNLIAQSYELDLAILVYNLNDISYLAPSREKVYEKVSEIRASVNWLTRNSYFANTFWMRWQAAGDPSISNYYSFVRDTYDNPSTWAQQRDSLTQLKALLQQKADKMLVITFPFLSDLNPDHEFLNVHQKLDLFWKEVDVPHLDLGPIFYDRPERAMVVSKYDAHPNERAHKIAAEAILKFILKELGHSDDRHGG